MKKSLLTVAVSVVLAAAMLVGAPVAMAAEGDGQWLDLERFNSLTVHLPEAYRKDFAACAPGEGGAAPNDDAHNLGIQVDLYLVSPADKVPGQDAYTFNDFYEPFEGLKELYGKGFTDPKTAADEWAKMSNTAAQALFAGEPGTSAATATVGADGTAVFEKDAFGKGGLPAGLYLMVAHEPGAPAHDVTEGEKTTLGYYRNIEETGETPASAVTMAYSQYYEYSFTPALISLPARGQVELEGDKGYTGGNTANVGEEWDYEADAMLKGSHQPRYGSIEITKSLSGLVGSEPATFVFEITVDAPAAPGAAADAKGEHYTLVRGVTFKGTDDQTVRVDRIPVGSKVTVKELYSGATYTWTAGDEGEKTVRAAEIVGFSFANEPTTEHKGGSGIVNSFEKGANDWTWSKDGVPQTTE